jgi:hypothetical protein
MSQNTNTPRGLNWLFGGGRRGPTRPVEPVPLAIWLETIGREHSGKSALKVAYFKGPLQGAQPSGLELTAAEPTVMAEWIRDALQMYRELSRRGLVTTLEPEVTEFHLFEADNRLAVLRHREVVGQVLSHTTGDSSDEQKAQYQTYVQNLSKATILQVVLSCPPDASAADMDRFEADLYLHAAYLRKALEVREAGWPCAVALVLTKLDTRFADEEEARTALTDERLRAILSRLVRIVEGSAKVGMGAIFPVSAFGFDNAVPAPEANGQVRVLAPGSSPLSQGETEWILKPDRSPAPFNLTGLVWWSLMAGHLLHPVDGREREMGRVAALLAEDLAALDAWFVPLTCKGGRLS